MTAALDLDEFLARHGDELVTLRRHLHAHPELAYAEHATTAEIQARLATAGLAPRPLPTGSGLVCDVGPAGAPVVVALRADIDALPLADAKDVPYRSTVAGVCHACGHDVHTTVVLGAGLALAEHAADLPAGVRLIFQPAEESVPGGALDVVSSGGLEGVRMIFGLHCDPKLDAGVVGLRVGPISAACDTVTVRLTGPGGHTARPQLTADLTWVIAKVVTELPAALTRLADPRWGMSLVFGAVHAGTAANVVPTSAEARGTLRTLDRNAWEAGPKLVERLLESLIAPYGAAWDLDYGRGSPPVVNDAGATAIVEAAARAALGGEAVVPTTQSLGGDDFSWYLEHVPGCYARLGVRRPGTDLDLHSARFDVDERAIAVGVRLLAQSAVMAAGRLAAGA